MRIADFDDRELFKNTVVQAQLLLLEGRDHLVAEVDSQEVSQNLVCQDLTVSVLDFVCHRTCI